MADAAADRVRGLSLQESSDPKGYYSSPENRFTQNYPLHSPHVPHSPHADSSKFVNGAHSYGNKVYAGSEQSYTPLTEGGSTSAYNSYNMADHYSTDENQLPDLGVSTASTCSTDSGIEYPSHHFSPGFENHVHSACSDSGNGLDINPQMTLSAAGTSIHSEGGQYTDPYWQGQNNEFHSHQHSIHESQQYTDCGQNSQLFSNGSQVSNTQASQQNQFAGNVQNSDHPSYHHSASETGNKLPDVIGEQQQTSGGIVPAREICPPTDNYHSPATECYTESTSETKENGDIYQQTNGDHIQNSGQMWATPVTKPGAIKRESKLPSPKKSALPQKAPSSGPIKATHSQSVNASSIQSPRQLGRSRPQSAKTSHHPEQRKPVTPTTPARPMTAPPGRRKKDGSSDSGVEDDKTSRRSSGEAKKRYGTNTKMDGYRPGGGNVQIFKEKVDFKSKVTPRTDTKSKAPPPSPGTPRSPTVKTPTPNVKSVSSRIRSMDNARHVPGGGDVVIQEQKVDVASVGSRIGSVANMKHKPGGGNVKIESKPLDLSSTKSKVGSTSNIKHKPAGGEKKILSQKLDWNAQSKVGSMDKAQHSPGGGNVKVWHSLLCP